MMANSNDFLRVLRKKTLNRSVEIEELRKLFFRFLPDCPEELGWDIFKMYFSESEEKLNVSLLEAEKLSEIIDLFSGEYEEDEIKITDSELLYISEGINDFALELSDETLLNVMRLVVARGII